MEDLLHYKELMLLPALAFWTAVGGKRPVWARWLGAQLLVALVVELVGMWMRYHGAMNLRLYNGYMVVEFICLWAVIGTSATPARYWRPAAAVGVSIATGLWLWEVLSTDGFATTTLIIGGALLALASGVALVSIMRHTLEPLHRLPIFWVLLAQVAYFMCFIPIFGLYNKLAAEQADVANTMLMLNDALFVLRYGLIGWSLFLLFRSSRTPDART